LLPWAARRKTWSEDTSLLSDRLGEARTKFVGGLNITSRSGRGRLPSALLLVANFAIALLDANSTAMYAHLIDGTSREGEQ